MKENEIEMKMVDDPMVLVRSSNFFISIFFPHQTPDPNTAKMKGYEVELYTIVGKSTIGDKMILHSKVED